MFTPVVANFLLRNVQHLQGLRMAELGCQEVLIGGALPGRKIVSSKCVMEWFGVKHTSFDIIGALGAEVVDLREPIPDEYCEQFDAVTNFGTIEHVSDQYMAFRNTHSLCKLGGWIFHALPVVGTRPGHCRYYYPESFVKALVAKMNYRILDYVITPSMYGLGLKANLILTLLSKEVDQQFISREEFDKLGVVDVEVVG